eukprot:1174187-Rhodomonas_salina.1
MQNSTSADHVWSLSSHQQITRPGQIKLPADQVALYITTSLYKCGSPALPCGTILYTACTTAPLPTLYH